MLIKTKFMLQRLQYACITTTAMPSIIVALTSNYNQNLTFDIVIMSAKLGRNS
jgi:hypothetical protein